MLVIHSNSFMPTGLYQEREYTHGTYSSNHSQHSIMFDSSFVLARKKQAKYSISYRETLPLIMIQSCSSSDMAYDGKF